MALDKMLYYRKDISHGGIDFYVRQGDTFKLKNGKARPIQYGFWRGKFYVGMVVTQGANDWSGLREVVFDKYGQGAKTFVNKDEYLWVGKNTIMALRYDENSGMGTYYIRSSSMEKQMD